MADEKLRILLEQRGAEQLENAVEGILKTVAATQAEIDRFQKKGGLGALAVGTEAIDAARARTSQLGVELLLAADRARELAIQIASAPESEIPRLTKEYADLEAQIASANAELRRMPRDLREGVADAVGSIGDVDSALAQIGSSLTGLGTSPLGRLAGGGIISGAGPLAGIGGAFQAGSDVFALAEALPRLSGALQQTKANTLQYIAAAGTQAVANSTVAASAASTIAPLSGTAASLAAIAVAAAPFLVVGAAVIGTFAAIESSLGDVRREAKAAINAERERIDTLRETRRILEEMTSSEIKSQIDDLQRNIDEETQARDSLVEKLKELYGESNYLEILNLMNNQGADLGTFGNVVGGISDLLVSDTKSGLQLTADEIERYNQSITDQQRQLELLQDTLPQKEETEARAQAEEQAKESALAYVEALHDQAEATQRTSQQIRELSSEQVTEEINDLNTRIAANKAASDEIFRQMQENQEAANFGLAENAGEMAAANEVLLQEFEKLQEAIVEDEAEISRLRDEVAPLVNLREAETAAVERQQETLEELAQKEEELTREREDSLSKLATIQQQIADAQAEFADKEALRAAEEAIKAARDAEDDLFRKRIESAKASEQARAAQERLTQAHNEYVQKQTDINKKFMETELKRSQDYYLKESRITEDFNRDRLRKLEDFNEQLRGAAEENDVRSFIRIQRSRDTTLQRDTEDFGVEARRRAEDFALASEEARKARQQELADLRIHHEQKRAQELASRTQENSEIARIEAEWARVRERREVEDQQRRIQLERDAFNRRIETLRQQERQLSTQIGVINAQIARNTYQTIVAAAANAVSAVRQSAARDLRPGSRSTVVNNRNITVNNTVGDVITSSDLRALQQAIVGAIQ